MLRSNQLFDEIRVFEGVADDGNDGEPRDDPRTGSGVANRTRPGSQVAPARRWLFLSSRDRVARGRHARGVIHGVGTDRLS